ncbi:MAG: hypothetical protein LBP80_05840 [Treponema sp.]|jgi:hypothetical protein|nr:hypothetical protein [Treponema sp.]
MKKVFALSLALSLVLIPPVFTQDEKPVIRVESFTFEGLGPQESQIIETLFQSYLSTLGTVVYPVSGDLESPPERDAGFFEAEIIPDFTFSARVVFDRDIRRLLVTVGDVQSGEISSFNAAYKTTGELVLKARAFMESVLIFGIQGPGPAPLIAENTAGGTERTGLQEIKAEPMNERRITGTWRGDHGIEMARLQPGGRGIAILSSGAQMELIYTIADNTLFITQNSANHERYYHPLPLSVARILAAQADPMRWEFLLYDNGATLRGIRISTAARYEGEEVLELIPNSARESGWTRPTR